MFLYCLRALQKDWEKFDVKATDPNAPGGHAPLDTSRWLAGYSTVAGAEPVDVLLDPASAATCMFIVWCMCLLLYFLSILQ